MGAKIGTCREEQLLDEKLAEIEKSILFADSSKTSLKYGPNRQLQESPCETILHIAIRLNSKNVFKNLLNHKSIRFDLENEIGLTAIDYMLCAEDPEYYFKLVLDNISGNINNSVVVLPVKGETFFHIGIRMEWKWLVEILLNKGADTRVQDVFGDYPIATAARHTKTKIFSLLLKNCTLHDLHHCNKALKSVWYYAFKEESLAKELVNHFNSINILDDKNLNKTTNLVAESVIDSYYMTDILLMFDDALLYNSNFIITAVRQNLIHIINKLDGAKIIELTKTPFTFQRMLDAAFETQNLNALSIIMGKMDKEQLNPQVKVYEAGYSDRWKTYIKLLSLITKETSESKSQHAILHTYLYHAIKLDIITHDANVIEMLSWTASQDDPMCLDALLGALIKLEIDFDVNAEYKGKSLLIRSCKPGFKKCFKKFLFLGANIFQTCEKGNNVMHFIVEEMSYLEKEKQEDEHLKPFNYQRKLDQENVIKKKLLSYKELIKSLFDHIVLHGLPLNGSSNWTKSNALIYLIYKIENKMGYSAMKLAFLKGANTFIEYIMQLDDVLKFEYSGEGRTYFNISYLLPTTKHPSNDFSKHLIGSESNKHSQCKRTCIEMLEMNTNKDLAVATLNISPMMILEKKYSKFCLVFFFTLMFFHILYMITLTAVGTQIAFNLARDIQIPDTYFYITYSVVPIEPVLGLIFIFIFIRRYVQKRTLADAETAIQYLLLLIFIVVVLLWVYLVIKRISFHDYLLSTCLFLGWIGSLSLSRGFKMTHYFYKMITHMVIYDVAPILFVYAFILLAFGFAMHVEFLAIGKTQAFPTALETLFMGFNLMMGQGDLVDDSDLRDALRGVGRTAWFIKMLYIVYTVLSTVVLLNLVIALMNSSYQQIQNKNESKWRLDVIAFGVQIELFFHNIMCPYSKVYTTKKLPKKKNEIVPNINNCTEPNYYYLTYKTKKLLQAKKKKEGSWALWEDFICCRS